MNNLFFVFLTSFLVFDSLFFLLTLVFFFFPNPVCVLTFSLLIFHILSPYPTDLLFICLQPNFAT